MENYFQDTSAANKLFVEAVQLSKSARNIEAVVWEDVLRKLNKIIENYPASELAVKLISGQNTGNISLESVRLSVKMSREEALRETGADQDAQSQFDLGTEYLPGNSIISDEAEAAKWFHKAADNNHTEAQFCLGIMYHMGNGVPKDLAESLKWFNKAADMNYADAQLNLGIMHANGDGVPKNDNEAFKWCLKAAEQGLSEAQYNLGHMYAGGRGVLPNEAEAINWYQKAAEQGHMDAKNYLKKIKAEQSKRLS
ncbi:MAG: hypothetical protein CMO98_10505 [Woeseia sp.]|nr:hypothetical protein [Woeseia sp.]|tara:strand:+ start:14944 stop:15705 length:762 start_codon:yes stop_codon:yes gene_type:complete